MTKKPNGRIDPLEIKPTHLQHLYRIARAVVAGDVPKVRGLAEHVVRAIRHQQLRASRERTKQRIQLRRAAREHQADLAQDVAAGRARAVTQSAAHRANPLYYRGSHG